LYLEVLGQRCLLSNYGLDPTVRVSHSDPFAYTDADHIEQQSGTLYPGAALETFMTVDPTNPNHIAVSYQQDRWSGGGSRSLMVGTSFDGGQSWYTQPIPGVTLVAGGTWARSSDPWIAFGADGALYATSLTVDGQGGAGVIMVSKSVDGGVTWLPPVTIPGSQGSDKESITTDPFNPLNVYVIWTGAYSRSTDGGQTFSPARNLGIGGGAQIVVLPDDTLVASDGCEIFRSSDQGQTFPTYVPFFLNCNPQQVTDPNTHAPLRAGLGWGDIAVDPNSGALYDVIEDAGVGHGIDGVAFTESLDGGFTWTTPVKINQTPTNIPQLDQQAFIPTVAVAADGTVGVTYYDFRNNTGGPTLPTDYWFVPGTPDGSGNITWGNEVRLTNKSFDFERAPFSKYGKFLGDYQGRATAGNDFLEFFGHPPDGHGGGHHSHSLHDDSVYFRRVVNLGTDTASTGSEASSPDQQLAASVVVDHGTIALALEHATGQPLSVDMPTALDLSLDSAAPVTAAFALDSQGLTQTAPSSDATLPDSIFAQDVGMSGAVGIS
jgi:hypothetical protein